MNGLDAPTVINHASGWHGRSCVRHRLAAPHPHQHLVCRQQQQVPDIFCSSWRRNRLIQTVHATSNSHHGKDDNEATSVGARQQQSNDSGTQQQHRKSRLSCGSQQDSSQHQPVQQPDAAQDPLLASMHRPLAGRQQSWQQRQQQQRQPRWQQRHRAGLVGTAKPSTRQDAQHVFAQCRSHQDILAVLKACQQQQPVLQTPEQQQNQSSLLLDSTATVGLMEQLASVSKPNSGGTGAVGGSSAFIEDQALQQILPLAYNLLEQHASTPPKAGASAMRSRDLLRCITCLASLKYSMPARLAELLESSGSRVGLSQLHMQQLSALVVNLAKAEVRPSNAWLVAFMQAAQAKFSNATLSQLSHLLSGLVRMGVKPAASWLDSMQEQAVQCLVEQAVRVQVTESQRQHQRAQQSEDARAAGGSDHALQQGTRSVSSVAARTPAGCQLHDVAQLLSALAEAKHCPKPQLAAALWGATAASLAVADVSALAELLSALGELQLVPPVTWMRQYYSSTARHLPQYKPWQLSQSIAAVGKLVRAAGTSAVQQIAQDSGSISTDCSDWITAALSEVHRQLGAFAARDLAALLAGLAALQLPLPPDQLTALCEEAKQKLPRFNTAGLASLLAAVVGLEQQQGLGKQQRVLLTDEWMEAYLREVSVKLPVFPADDLAAVLLGLRASALTPSALWLDAAAVQLQSKLTVLPPATLVHVFDALLSMGHTPGPAWVVSAVAALENRMVELQGKELLVLLQLLVAVGCKPSSGLLENARWAMQQVDVEQQQQQRDRSGRAVAGVADVCEHLLQQLEIGTASTIVEDTSAVVSNIASAT